MACDYTSYHAEMVINNKRHAEDNSHATAINVRQQQNNNGQRVGAGYEATNVIGCRYDKAIYQSPTASPTRHRVYMAPSVTTILTTEITDVISQHIREGIAGTVSPEGRRCQS